MKTIKILSIVALLLGGLASTAAAQDDCATFDRERGECSPGTQAPSQEALLNAIRGGSPTRLMGMLEYGEMLECYECVPALARRVITDDNSRMREFSAWWLRRRHLAKNHLFIEFRSILQGDYPAWTSDLGVPQEVMRARAAEALGEFLDPNALAPLAEAAMGDAEPIVRDAAVSALGRLNHPEGNAVLAAALSDSAPEVRRAALSSIVRVNFFREHDALLGTLADDDAVVRREGALLVGQMRVGAGVDALAGLLRADEDANVRRAAAWSLGMIGDGVARDVLREARASESNRMVLDAIEIALRR